MDMEREKLFFNNINCILHLIFLNLYSLNLFTYNHVNKGNCLNLSIISKTMHMKKNLLVFALLGIMIGFANAQDVPNKRLKSGVWMKAGYDATFSNFLTTGSGLNNTKAGNFGVDFQLGTTFYIGPRIGNMLRFGLDAGWLDFSYIGLNTTYFPNGQDYFLNFLELGPIISFSPNKYIAFDMYGRVVPSFSFLYYESGTGTNQVNRGYWGYNTNGLMGVTFRVKVFAVGFEYNFGGMEYLSTDESTYSNTAKVKINNLRILLGFKF
jgi:hypothetical protein